MTNNGSSKKGFKKTYIYTSPLSELSVEYRCVPVLLTMNVISGWKQEHKAPAIPVSTIDIGGEKKNIPNPTDPDYQSALAQYEQDARDAAQRFQWRKAIILSEENRQMVKELRAEVESDPEGAKLTGDDEQVFVENILCVTVDEFIQLQNLILRTSQPTVEGTREAKESFRN